MKFHYNKSLIEAANHYASIIVNNQDSLDTDLLRKTLGFSDRSTIDEISDNTMAEDSQGPIDRVGIWKREQKANGEFWIRDANQSHNFHLWAKTKELKLTKGKPRIAFIGESVARGFLFDPYITPATILEEILNLNVGEVEIVDLARTSVRIQELTELCISSLELKPDAMVVFAGNNWRESILPLGEQDIDALLIAGQKNDGFQSLTKVMERIFDRIIDPFMQTLKDISENSKIPIVFVIPEFNLKDWKSTVDEKVLAWTVAQTEEWENLSRSAKAALEEGDFDSAQSIARSLIAINAINPSGYEIMAQTYLQQGEMKEARKYFELMRDTMAYQVGSPPGSISYIRNRTLELSQAYGITVVDLPEVFNRHLDGGIPGNDLFIDYCHLTVEGMEVAMLETARALIPVFSQEEKKTIKKFMVKADPEVLSRAHFFSAIHCAHRGGQPYEVLMYHCAKALQYSSKIEELMVEFMDMVTRKIPWEINKNYGNIYMKGSGAQYPVLIQFKNCMLLDLDLVRAIEAAMVAYGTEIKNDMDALRIQQHAPTAQQAVNLLETYYKDTYYYNMLNDGIDPYLSYMRATHRETKFILISRDNDDLSVDLALRTPWKKAGEQAKAVVSINGVEIGQVEIGYDWNRAICKISKVLLRNDGVNQLTISWPYPNENQVGKNRLNSNKGVQKLLISSRPAFGEIASCIVKIDSK